MISQLNHGKQLAEGGHVLQGEPRPEAGVAWWVYLEPWKEDQCGWRAGRKRIVSLEVGDAGSGWISIQG